MTVYHHRQNSWTRTRWFQSDNWNAVMGRLQEVGRGRVKGRRTIGCGILVDNCRRALDGAEGVGWVSRELQEDLTRKTNLSSRYFLRPSILTSCICSGLSTKSPDFSDSALRLAGHPHSINIIIIELHHCHWLRSTFYFHQLILRKPSFQCPSILFYLFFYLFPNPENSV